MTDITIQVNEIQNRVIVVPQATNSISVSQPGIQGPAGPQLETGTFITSGQTGEFYPTYNPSGYVTGVNTGDFVTTGQTGVFLTSGSLAPYATTASLTAYVQTSQTGAFITSGQTGAFYPASNPSGYITTGETGSFGGNSSPVFATGFVDFGFPSGLEDSTASTTVLASWVSDSDNFFVSAVSGINHSVEDALLDGVSFCVLNVINGVSFDVFAYSANNTWGRYDFVASKIK